MTDPSERPDPLVDDVLSADDPVPAGPTERSDEEAPSLPPTPPSPPASPEPQDEDDEPLEVDEPLEDDEPLEGDTSQTYTTTFNWRTPGSRRGRFVMVVVPLVVVLVAGLVVGVSIFRHQLPWDGSRTTSGPPLGPAVVVAPLGAQVATVKEPSRVRFEAIGPAGTSTSVHYGSGGTSGTRTENVALPWAVEAPLVSTNTVVSLSVRDLGGASTAARPVLVCRVWLDSVLVDETVGRGSVSCDASVNPFRTSRVPGDGTGLTGVVAVTPHPATLPTLPATASTVTFEAYTSVPTSGLSLRFGSSGTTNKTELEGQTAPVARRATVPPGVTFVSVSADDYSTDPPSTVLCRILVDGIPVVSRTSPISVSCSLSLSLALGS